MSALPRYRGPAGRGGGATSTGTDGRKHVAAASAGAATAGGSDEAAASWFVRTYNALSTVDCRSLAAYRIMCGIYLLVDTYTRLTLPLQGIYWYTSSDVEPLSVLGATDTPHGFIVHQWWFTRGTVELQYVLFTLHVLFILAMLVGYKTRLSTFLVWFSVAALQGRSDYFNGGADKLMRFTLVWAIMLPLGERWSLDAFLERGVRRRIDRHRSFAVNGWMLQQFIMYTGVVVNRYAETPWGWRRGTALYFVLSSTLAVTPTGQWLSTNLPFTYVSTVATNIYEVLIGVAALFSPNDSYLRLLAFLMVVALHAGIAMALRLFDFHSMGILTVIPLLPGWVWPASTSVDRNDTVGAAKKRGGGGGGSGSGRVHTSSRTVKIVSAVVLCYMIYNAGAVDFRLWPSVDEGNIGLAFRFSQGWTMFGHVNQRGPWWTAMAEVPNTTGDGDSDGGSGSSEVRVLDVFDALVHDNWTTMTKDEFRATRMQTVPAQARLIYGSKRIERYFDRAAGWPSKTKKPRLEGFMQHWCTLLPPGTGKISLSRMAYRIREPNMVKMELPTPRFDKPRLAEAYTFDCKKAGTVFAAA